MIAPASTILIIGLLFYYLLLSIHCHVFVYFFLCIQDCFIYHLLFINLSTPGCLFSRSFLQHCPQLTGRTFGRHQNWRSAPAPVARFVRPFVMNTITIFMIYIYIYMIIIYFYYLYIYVII